MVEQQADHFLAAFDGGAVESCETEVLAGVDVGAVREQFAHNLEVASRDGGVERSDSSRVARGSVRIGSVREEEPHHVEVTEEGCQSERRESVGCDAIRPRRILRKEIAERRDRARRARVEDVDACAPFDEDPCDFGVPVIHGEPNRRNAPALRIEEPGISVEELYDLVGFSALHRVEETLRLVHAARIIGSLPPLPDFGLTPAEARRLRNLSPPWRIQKFLDELDYDVSGKGCRSPRRVLRERKVQCMDAALFAAGTLRVQGKPPLILDLEAVQDDDHVLALYRVKGLWGSIARSNYSGLRFREPLFESVRALVLSYVEGYFNLRRQKTLRRYSKPFDLSFFDAREWMTTEEDLWEIPNYLVGIRHYRLLSHKQERSLSPVSSVVFGAGLVGREGEFPKRGSGGRNVGLTRRVE